MRVVGRPGARVGTVVVCRSDRIVPGSVVKELCLIDSMRPAQLHSVSCYAIQAFAQPRHDKHGDKSNYGPAAFPIPIGDSGAPGDRDSISQAVVVVVDYSLDRLIPEGGCHVTLVVSVVAVAAAAVVRELAHRRVRESRLP